MAERKLKVMLSSRSTKTILDDGAGGQVKLADARKEIKRRAEAEAFLGDSLLEVWINEGAVAQHGPNAWDECIEQALRCDLFVAIYDGSAGWLDKANPGLGICHAEFDVAHGGSPRKVAVVAFENAKATKPEDHRFADALRAETPFQTMIASELSGRVAHDTLVDTVLRVIRELLLKTAQEGARQQKQSGPNTGQALAWSRLDYAERADEIRRVIFEQLKQRPKAIAIEGSGMVVLDLAGTQVLVVPHAVPAAFSIPKAREHAGQPFLSDHQTVASLDVDLADVGGPIHLIGCSKSVTETQAISMLGFPDATIVPGPFGIYVADRTQKIQLCLIKNCADEASTTHGVQRWFEWLARSREQSFLVERARARRAIADVIAAQQ